MTDRKPSEHAREAVRILREPIEHASTPAMSAPDMTSLKARTFQSLLEAARDNNLARLQVAICLMVEQTSVRDVAHDIRLALARQYGP